MALSLPPFIPGSNQLRRREVLTAAGQRFNRGKRFVDLSLTVFCFRDQARDAPSVPRDDQGIPSLHIVQELEEPRFCFGRLDLSHPSIVDQSNRLVNRRSVGYCSGKTSVSLVLNSKLVTIHPSCSEW